MRSHRVGLVVLSVALLIAFTGLYALSNLTATGQRSENRTLGTYQPGSELASVLRDQLHLPPLDSPLPTLLVGVALAALIVAVQRRWRDLAVVLVTTPAAVVIGTAFKAATGRPRLVEAITSEASYPSGHAIITFALALSLLLAVPTVLRGIAAPILLGWAALVAGAVQGLGWHRPSEVLGSALLVAAVFLLARAVIGASQERAVRRPRSSVGSVVAIGTIVVLGVVGSLNPVPWLVLLDAVTAIASTALIGLVSRAGAVRRAGRGVKPAATRTDAVARSRASV